MHYDIGGLSAKRNSHCIHLFFLSHRVLNYNYLDQILTYSTYFTGLLTKLYYIKIISLLNVIYSIFITRIISD